MGCSNVPSLARKAKTMSLKIVIVINSSWNIINFRSGLVKAFIKQNYEVLVIAPQDKYSAEITKLGCRLIPLEMDNQGTNPFKDLLLFVRLFNIMRLEKPNIFLGYTVKPNIYGSLAAHFLNIPVINNVTGLGTVFINGGPLNSLLKTLYRLAFSKSFKVFFQNEDDRKLFISEKLVKNSLAFYVPGSGIDLKKFIPVPLPRKTTFRFLLISRMLWDKGVGEFVDAARKLQENGVKADFCLLGFLDVKNPKKIAREEMDGWVKRGWVRYLGVSSKIEEQIARANCVVLPSYREGLPKSLLEAAAMARPIVTTDTAGCRDVVDSGINGYLCRTKDSDDLAKKMLQIFNLKPNELKSMGLKGRKKIEENFDEKIVINLYLNAIQERPS